MTFDQIQNKLNKLSARQASAVKGGDDDAWKFGDHDNDGILNVDDADFIIDDDIVGI